MDIEIRRIQAVRESVGESVHILVDVNWGWTLSQAIQIGRKLQEYNVFWLEDPLASDDWDDVATLKNSLDLPIAAGESVCGKWEFRDFFMKRTADIPQIDLQYVGGVTEWMRVAGMAQAWNLPVASHVFHDFSVHLVAAAPNGLIVEYLPWWEEIYQEPLKIIDGKARISDKPGVGLDLNPDAIKKYSLS
jgi:L-alanine-DL-glutamate epimerase-like enolase superfamily enzyme